MNEPHRHTDPALTADDLRRYRAGLLSAHEARRVEKALLEQPLYDEVLDGMEAMGNRPIPMAELRERLQRRVGQQAQQRRLGAGWWATAASVSIVAGGWLLWYVQRETPQPNQPTGTASTRRLPLPAPRPSDLAEPEAAQPGVAFRQRKIGDAHLQKTERTGVTPTPNTALSAPRPDSSDRLVGIQEVQQSNDERVASAPVLGLPPSDSAPARAAKSAPSMAFSKRSSEARTDKKAALAVLQGRIVDAATQQPLPGVSVLVPGTRQGAVTGNNGQFELKDMPPGTALTATSVGYEAKTFTLSDLMAGDITLKPDVRALNEVVVTGYGGQKRKTVTGAVTPLAPNATATAPAGFADYVRRQKRLPPEAATKGIAGTVRLRFRVQKDGTIGRVRVAQGLGYGCDEEAIRLLREGPRWQPARRRGNVINGWTTWEIAFP